MGEILGSGGGESVRRRDFASLNRFALPASVKSGKAGYFRRPFPSSGEGKIRRQRKAITGCAKSTRNCDFSLVIAAFLPLVSPLLRNGVRYDNPKKGTLP
jgi:hypothetical protein